MHYDHWKFLSKRMFAMAMWFVKFPNEGYRIISELLYFVNRHCAKLSKSAKNFLFFAIRMYINGSKWMHWIVNSLSDLVNSLTFKKSPEKMPKCTYWSMFLQVRSPHQAVKDNIRSGMRPYFCVISANKKTARFFRETIRVIVADEIHRINDGGFWR